MIAIDVNKHSEAWHAVCDDDKEYVNSGDYTSLLEAALRDEVQSGRFPKHAYEVFDAVRRSLTAFWSPSNTPPQYGAIQRKDITHIRRVLFNIERVLFPIPQDSPGSPGCTAVHAIYDIDWYNIVALLCSAYLHDYAKGQYHLIIPLLAGASRDAYLNTVVINDLSADQYEMVEHLHAGALFPFLNCLIAHDDHESAQDALRELFPPPNILAQYIEEVGYAQDLSLEPGGAADAHRLLFRSLWALRHEHHPESARSLLIDVQIICCLHKPDIGNEGEGESSDWIWSAYPTISHETRQQIELLAALLRLSDSLDLTKERIDPESELAQNLRFSVTNSDAGRLPQSRERLFARWIRYLMVDDAVVTHRSDYQPEGSVSTTIEVILKYRRFADWQQYLLDVRRAVESDFIRERWLAALERAPRPGVPGIRVRLLFDVVTKDTVRKLEEEFGPGVVQSFFLSVRSSQQPQNPPAGYNYSLISPQRTLLPGATLRFSPLSESLKLPTNRNLLYVLSYLDLYPGAAVLPEVLEMLGVPASQSPIPSAQDEVEAGRLLQLTDGGRQAYSLNRVAVAEVQKLLLEFRTHPVLVRQKVAELEHLGHLLPFSRRDAETVRTGIPGLDQVLSPLQKNVSAVRGLQHSRNTLVVGRPGSGKTTLLAQVLHWSQTVEQRHVVMFMLDEVGTAVLKTCKQHFGWDVPFAVSVFPPGSSDAELAKQFFRELHGRIEREQADLVAIDGLSRLRAVLGAQFADRLGTFFRALQIKGITGLFSAEEPADRLEVEEYQADGIIHLRSGETGRTLEVEKLRGQSYAAAAHPFEILDLAALPNEGGPDGVSPTFNPYRPGINVYPNERFYASQAVADYGRPQPAPGSDVSMGIPGLDRLLGGSRNGKHGYSEGDSILVLGSAGAGKTLFGLHFLKTEIEQRARAATATEPLKPGVLWLSFEGPKISLERATATFDETVGYKGALKSLPYIFTPVALLVPEKILFYLANAAQRSAERPGLDLKRLVIDSVTEIETAFSNPSRFRRFMRTLVDLLSSLDSHDPPLS